MLAPHSAHARTKSSLRGAACSPARLGRYAGFTALALGVVAWGPKLAHLSLSWLEATHMAHLPRLDESACMASPIPHLAHLAILAAATVAESMEIYHHVRAHGLGHQAATGRAHLIAAAWAAVLFGSMLCKAAHLLLSWGVWLGLPCTVLAGWSARLFSPAVQVVLLLLVSVLSVYDLLAILRRRAKPEPNGDQKATGEAWAPRGRTHTSE